MTTTDFIHCHDSVKMRPVSAIDTVDGSHVRRRLAMHCSAVDSPQTHRGHRELRMSASEKEARRCCGVAALGVATWHRRTQTHR